MDGPIQAHMEVLVGVFLEEVSLGGASGPQQFLEKAANTVH
jgi:hypothetical protein